MTRTPISNSRTDLLAGALLWLLLLATWLLWRPGLGGQFLFDDFPNLSGLAGLDVPGPWYDWLQYILSGVSSVLGRPISQLSFVLQAPSWPQHPEDFIRVNILLHLLNAALLYWGLERLRRLQTEWPTWLPWAVTALWVMAPLHVSGVLYPVQRMTLLSGTFVLAGLLLHLHGRNAATTGRNGYAYFWMTLGVCVGLGFGTLAKESAVLYPLLILVLEGTLLQSLARPPRWRLWSGIWLLLPLLLLLGYLVLQSSSIARQFEQRPFSLGERLLTESRVLFHYLGSLLAPSPYGARLLYDDYPISHALWAPPQTLLSVLAWMAVTLAALRWRRALAPLSFAVLWYLAAHALESSALPLEIAFEHRNYLAAVGPLLGLVWLAHRLLQSPAAARLRPYVFGAGALYMLFVGACLHFSTVLWGEPREQARHWYITQPDSRRAVHELAGHLFEHNLVDLGRSVYQGAMAKWPHDATFPLALVQVACQNPRMAMPALETLEQTLRHSDSPLVSVTTALQGPVDLQEKGLCPQVPAAQVLRLLDIALESAQWRTAAIHIQILRSRLLESMGERAAALDALADALQATHYIPHLLQAIRWALELDDLPRADGFLQVAESGPRISAVRRWIFRKEIQGHRQLYRIYEELEQEGRRLEAEGAALASPLRDSGATP